MNAETLRRLLLLTVVLLMLPKKLYGLLDNHTDTSLRFRNICQGLHTLIVW
jgi:hypothetical protein